MECKKIACLLNRSSEDLKNLELSCEELKKRVAEYGLIESGIRLHAKKQKLQRMNSCIDKATKEIRNIYASLKAVEDCIKEESDTITAEMQRKK